jgi:hypothetical protein
MNVLSSFLCHHCSEFRFSSHKTPKQKAASIVRQKDIASMWLVEEENPFQVGDFSLFFPHFAM